METIAVGISVLALGVSGWTAWRQTQHWKLIERRLQQEERGRDVADVRARVMREGAEAAIVIENRGPAVARSVDLKWGDYCPLDEDPRIPLPWELDSGEARDLWFGLSHGTPVTVEVTVLWADGRRGRQSRTFHLDLLTGL